MEIRRLWTMRGSIVTGADFLSNSQLAAIIITPIITAALSVVGSACIVFIILFRKQGRSATEAENSGSLEFPKRKSFVRNPRTNRLQTYHRLMLAMSLADIVNSGWIMLGPVPNLKETGIVLASGNTATCAAAGFFFHLGFSIMYYNISLMLYYVLVIRFGMKPQMIARVEPLMHIISIGKPLIESIIGLSYKAFNPWAYTGCYFATYPPLCGKEGGHPCTRGQLASLFYLIFTLGPQLLFVAAFHAFIFIIYSSIRAQTRRASQIALTDGHRARKRAVVTQSILYSVIFVNTHVWFFITSLIGIFAKNVVSLNDVLYKLAFLSTLFYPAQGFFNFLIFIRPRYQRERAAFPDKSWLWVVRFTIFGTETPWPCFDSRPSTEELVNASVKRSNESDGESHVPSATESAISTDAPDPHNSTNELIEGTRDE